jgi:hypothetical protein
LETAWQFSVRAPCALFCATWFEAQPASAATTKNKPNDFDFIERS